NVTADNLSSDNVTSWQNKLGINDKADKSDITNLTTKIDNGKFTSLKVSANGGTQDEIKANENIDFSGANGINVNYDATKNKFTFSADIDSIADNNVFSNKYAMLNGSNLKPTNGFDQGAWRTALGLTNDNIASIFEAGTDISITPNGNKYTIAYTGGGTGGISETKVKEIIKKYIGGDITNPTNSNDELITHNVKEQETTENENIIAAINKINQEGIGFVHVNGEKLTRDASGKSKNDSSAEGNNAIAIGPKSRAIGNNSIAIGVGNVVKGENSGAIGDPSMVNADGSYSVGNYNTVNTGADGSFILGNNVFIERDAKQALALGEKTKVSVAGGVALGSGSVANRKTNLKGYIPDGATTDQEKAIKETSKGSLGVVSVGETSADGKTVIASRQITGVAAGTEDSDAVNVAQLKAVQKVVNQGSKWIAVNTKKFDKNGKVVDNSTQAEAKGVNSVAIGAGSNTNTMLNGNEVQRPNTVSVGGLNKDGTVTQRTISNVAPGVLNSDAATMGQLRAGLNDVYGKLGEYKKDASAGTASALAVGNLPQATIPGKGMISLGSGFYDGQSAMAIGLSKMSDSGKWVFKGSASYDSQEKAGAALSVGFHF
ncbi:MAG: YadA-like family protein, partial [Campylobacter ureolyticus]|nr:YadA-like family protein [Campylobacter ureolyticus]